MFISFDKSVCLAGYGRSNPSAACARCPVGQFSSDMSNDPCDTCQAGETTEDEGSTVCGKDALRNLMEYSF